MAQYNNIYDILKQFELQVVKGNHYTKSQADQQFVQSTGQLDQLAALLKNDKPGVISKEVDSSGLISINLDNTFAHTTYVDNKVTEEIGKIVQGAPELLDTLAEVSRALNDDPAFYQTMKNMIDTKADKTSLSNYQPKTPLLTSLIGNLAGTQTGLVKVTSSDSSGGANIVSIDTTTYLKPSDLNGYATQSWVEAKNYLTQHQDISGKADRYWVDSTFQKKSDILTKILNTAGGSTTGLLKIQSTGSSEGNIVSIDTNNYLVANDLVGYAKSVDVYTKTQADGTFAKASALNDYQRTDVMLNNLLSAVKGSKSGLLKVQVSSSGDNVVGVDNTAYATVANMTITDEQLQTLVEH